MRKRKDNTINKKESGRIVSYFSGVAKIEGLPHVFLHEKLVNKENVTVAIVIGFDKNFVEALFFDDEFDLDENIFRSGLPFSIKISETIIGRVLDGFGKSRDKFGGIMGDDVPIFRSAPSIIVAHPVNIDVVINIATPVLIIFFISILLF